MRRYFLNYPQFQWPRPRLSADCERVLAGVRDARARRFYEQQAAAGRWDADTLARHVNAGMYEHASVPPLPENPEDVIKTEYNLGFISEQTGAPADITGRVLDRIERFLLEMGAGFAFVERNRRVVIGSAIHRIPLVLFHRGLRCLVLVDILPRRFEPEDVGRMNAWRTYTARTDYQPAENPPIGLMICSDPNEPAARYALGDLENSIFVSRLLLELPREKAVARAAADSERVAC